MQQTHELINGYQNHLNFVNLDRTSFCSTTGDLYEHDKNSKPAWKKHIKKEGSAEDITLALSKGCSFKGPNGASSMSLFLLTKVLHILAYMNMSQLLSHVSSLLSFP